MHLDDMTKKYLIESFTGTEAKPEAENKLPRSHSFQSQAADLSLIPGDRTKINNWNFDAWEFSPEELRSFIIFMLDDLGLIKQFDFNLESLQQFIQLLEKNYLNNPYHNFRHACDVAQMAYMFLCHSSVNQFLGKLEQLALMLGAVGHDVCHPGTTNAFQVKVQTELAETYNDNSVLENMHCCKTFKFLKESKLLASLSVQEYRHLRKLIVGSILSTDMTSHFEIVGKFTTHVETCSAENKPPFTEQADRQLLINMLLHAADISNLSRPPTTAKKWSDCIFEEYLNQVKSFFVFWRCFFFFFLSFSYKNGVSLLLCAG
jgi:hypothetical protein